MRLTPTSLFSLLLLLRPALGWAQGVGIGTATPNAKAALDIRATDKGLLIPRLDSSQRAAIPSPPDGLMVFQTDGRKGFWYAVGGAWVYIPDKTKSGDNLGNHTATRNLNLGTFRLVGNGGTEGLTISSTGRVGLGVNASSARLEVVAPSGLPAMRLLSNDVGPHVYFAKSGESAAGVLAYIATGISGVDPYRNGSLELRGVNNVALYGDGDTGSPDLMVKSDGKVGIGTSAPSANLEVSTTTGLNLLRLATADLGPHFYLQRTGDAGVGVISYIGTTAPGVGTHRLGALELRGENRVVLYGDGATNSPDLVVDADGKVGIGTSTPTTNLDVTTATETNLLRLSTGGVGPHLLFQRTGDTGLGAVAYIGTSAPAVDIYRKGSLELRGENSVALYGDGATNSPDLYVTAAGNTGLGTSAPGVRLDVDGALALRANPTDIVLTTSPQSVAVGNRSLLRIGSDNAAAPLRVLTLGNGAAVGQLLLVVNASSAALGVANGGFQLNDSGNVRLQGPRAFGPNDLLTLVWDGAAWVEVSFANN